MSQTFVAMQTRPISESIILSQSEAEFARDLKEKGSRIIENKGRFWQETHYGFYQSVHWLARMSVSEADCPALHWGYRTTLAENDATVANGTMPVNLLQDISRYDLEHLHSSRRYDLRKSRNLVTVVELTGPALLEAEGYQVLRSSWVRTGHGSMPTKDAYQADLARTCKTRSVILAGIIDGRLGGYLKGCAVGSTAYIDSVILATEYLPTQIGTALVFDFVQICRHSVGIREVVYGQHSREDPNLVAYKERMGFPVVYVPSIVRMYPFIKTILRRYKPHIYYRLTGCG